MPDDEEHATARPSGAADQPHRPPPAHGDRNSSAGRMQAEMDPVSRKVLSEIGANTAAGPDEEVQSIWPEGPRLFGIGEARIEKPSKGPPYRALTNIKLGPTKGFRKGDRIKDPFALKLIEGIHYEAFDPG